MPADPSSCSSPEALVALAHELTAFDPGTRKRGDDYARSGRVLEFAATAQTITGVIIGSDPEAYETSMTWTGSHWKSRCTCPVEVDCKHAYAVGRVWLSRQSARATPGVTTGARLYDDLAALPPAASKPPPPSRPRAPSFREEWTPKLAARLGRALAPFEGKLLDQLSALFNDLRAHRYFLPLSRARAHGFEFSRDAAAAEWDNIFQDWWPPTRPPADPWALWQYLAYDAERAGRPIPEVFRPMTDTAAVRAAVEPRFLQRELDLWRTALANHALAAQTDAPDDGFVAPADLRLVIQPAGRSRIEVRPNADKPWKPATQKWLGTLETARLASLDPLPPPARALALFLRLEASFEDLRHQTALSPDLLEQLFAHPPAHPAIVLPNGAPFRIEPEPLRYVVRPDTVDSAGRLVLTLVRPDLTPTPPDLAPAIHGTETFYLLDSRLWRGPLPLPSRLPAAALADAGIISSLRQLRVGLPAEVEARFRHVVLRPLLRCWLAENLDHTSTFHAQLFATGADPACRQEWKGHGGWQWTADGAPPPARPGDPQTTYDLSAANTVGAFFGDFALRYSDWSSSWLRPVTRTFAEDFTAWHASLPPGTPIEVSPDLQGLLGAPLRARLNVSLTPAAGSGQDWFDLSLQFQPDDVTLTPAELQLLIKARGGWVRLPSRGYQRLAVNDTTITPAEHAALARLGLAAEGDVLSGQRTTHRYHALQLAEAPVDDAELAARLRARAAELRALPPPPLPAGLRATLRPYQAEGFHFLSHLAAQGLGGVLADDMGLGKTLQTLAWLLWLAERPPTPSAAEDRPFRALVVCPKSVVPNWCAEAARFAPALTTARLTAGQPPAPEARLLVVNYAQLRLRATDLGAIPWDAVVLDEAQNIKNPASATARIARELPARHRLVLTGTPIENRLLDLWSLFAFAQPGILGPQAAFQRLYNDKDDAPGARARLATRVRPFLLRRTKGQVARDLPARIEEEIACELEGPQRALYDAELKRARQLLLSVETSGQFDAQRFNILQSLLRLRQICCDPRLVGLDPAEAAAATTAPAPKKRGRPAKIAPPATVSTDATDSASSAESTLLPPPPSAKLEALLDTLEPLVAEGHRVLIFSQFVQMLELIRAELTARAIGHLLLTGKTENREELVNTFQAPDGPPVFLLSLKAAGSGLNLTAASYVVLFDPWWNPAVEAQAIDRTHRIGQTNKVIAYRLIAKDTVEEKIRALQREKAAMAAAVVQEESLATVMDLESLRRILG